MRVLHYCHTFSSVSQTFIYDYVTELHQRGIDVHVAVPTHINTEECPFSIRSTFSVNRTGGTLGVYGIDYAKVR